MIEVELKCLLSEHQESLLVEDAVFAGEEELCDVYYDDARYSLSLRDFWLRKRNGHFTLKTPAGEDSSEIVARRNEIEGEDEIARILGIPFLSTLEESLIAVGYRPLYTLVQHRRKFQKDGIFIDIDRVTFDGGTCDRCELEILVAHQDEVDAATQRLVDFAALYHLEPLKLADGASKLIGLIKRMNPEHYALLQEALHFSSKS